MGVPCGMLPHTGVPWPVGIGLPCTGGYGMIAGPGPTLGGTGPVVIWMWVTLPSGTDAVTVTEFSLSPIKARMREAVPWMAFCMFLQR